ncbi:ATP-binding protein [Azospirillum sp. ST 5-10]|uniref:sensor histidine kinase n=1 Tax=unclassified Azospirillum TaxID=2630922 RepID=UPI003F4A354B
MAALRILHSLTFRLALGYLALFTVSVALLLGGTYWAVVYDPLRRVRATLAAETATLDGVLGDMAVLAARLAARADTPAERRPFHALVAGDGTVVSANLPRWPHRRPGESWLRFELEDFSESDDDEYEILAHDVPLPGGGRLLLGRDTEDIDEREELIGQALAWGTGVTVSLGLVGGLLMSLAVARRIEAVNRAARLVMDGDLSGRVPVRGADDDFDHLADTLNAMLDRIEALVQSVSRVSDSIAHELRTPLTRLHADLEELVLAHDGDPVRRRLAEEALEETVRLHATFDALLRIARIETGRHTVAGRPVALATLLEDAAELHAPAAEERDQRIAVAADPGLGGWGDPDLLFQAVSNLLDNAIKYGPRGGLVEVAGRRCGGTVEIAVRDAGPGIPAEHRARATERFYRVPGSEAVAGTGLGLSLVAAIAAAHGGALRLEDGAPGLRAVLRLPGGPVTPASAPAPAGGAPPAGSRG